MYRDYENPRELENQLKELKQMYLNAIANNSDENTIVELDEEIASLEERINYAWQDEYEDEF